MGDIFGANFPFFLSLSLHFSSPFCRVCPPSGRRTLFQYINTTSDIPLLCFRRYSFYFHSFFLFFFPLFPFRKNEGGSFGAGFSFLSFLSGRLGLGICSSFGLEGGADVARFGVDDSSFIFLVSSFFFRFFWSHSFTIRKKDFGFPLRNVSPRKALSPPFFASGFFGLSVSADCPHFVQSRVIQTRVKEKKIISFFTRSDVLRPGVFCVWYHPLYFRVEIT